MMTISQQKRLESAFTLLSQDTTSVEKFESIRVLIADIDPKLDKLLEDTKSKLDDIRLVKQGEVLELSAKHLPEETAEEKKRKKAILIFIKNYKSLRSEVERIKLEWERSENNSSSQSDTILRLIRGTKGPLGIVTLAAIIIVTAVYFNNQPITPSQINPSPASETIEVIIIDGKQVPISELRIGLGSECMADGKEAQHYHAKQGTSVSALDGSKFQDPGGCGYGKVADIAVTSVPLNN